MDRQFREANPEEADRLTEIALLAKQYWSYPEAYYRIWQEELLLTEDYLQENAVYVAEQDGQPIAYAAITALAQSFSSGTVSLPAGFWLDHLFVLPAFIGQGIGSQLITIAKEYCRLREIATLQVISDPYASEFYKKQGAQYLGEAKALNIAERRLPVYQFQIERGEV